MHVNVHLFLSFLGMIVGIIICNIYAEYHKVENNYVRTLKIVVDENIALTELKYYIFKGAHVVVWKCTTSNEILRLQRYHSIYFTSKFITLSINLLIIIPKIHDVTNSPHNQSIY